MIGAGTAKGRALRLRCPWCGVGAAACASSASRATSSAPIYINYGAAVVLALVLHLFMQYVWHVAIEVRVSPLGALTATFGLIFFRWARALWLAFDLAIDPPEPHEFAPTGTR